MQRRYDVYIEGKPLVIAEAPPFSALPLQWLCMRVDHESEIQAAVQLLTHNEGIKGIHLFSAGEQPLWKLFKEGYIRVKAAGGVVLDEQGRLLAIRRLGKWDLPKGKVEKGEAIDAAALREVQEECGIQELQLLDPLMSTWHTYVRNGKQHLKRTEWFLMRSSSKEALVPQVEEDIEEVRWVGLDEAELIKEDTYPSLLPVLVAWEASVR
ncbi:MAG: NUDIX domain-containing protein [Flavobacteriales bacterium]